MPNIKVITDSSVQLSPEEIEKYGITVVPLSITIDDKTYVEEKILLEKTLSKKWIMPRNYLRQVNQQLDVL